MKAAMQLSCDDYFTAGPPSIRNFLDNHYDNFYTHYMATRIFKGRPRTLGMLKSDPDFTEEKLLALAIANMSTLDGVYPVDGLQRLEDDLLKKAGRGVTGMSLADIRVNVGEGDQTISRMEKLRALGATSRTFNKIAEMTRLDREIWRVVQCM